VKIDNGKKGQKSIVETFKASGVVFFFTTASEFEKNVKPYCSALTALFIKGKVFSHVNSSVIYCIKLLCIGVWEQLSPGITGELLLI
jgi:hypothetical protein